MFKLRYVLASIWTIVISMKCQSYMDPLNFGIFGTLSVFLILKLHNCYFKYVAENDRVLWGHKEEKKRVFGINKSTNDLTIKNGTVLMRILNKLDLLYNYIVQKKPIGVILKADKCQNKRKMSKKSKKAKKEVKKRTFCYKGIQVQDSNMNSNLVYNSNFDTLQKDFETRRKEIEKLRSTLDNSKTNCSPTIGNNENMLTPLGSYNHIAENMVNTPIYVCSWKEHMTSKPHLGSTKKYRKICFEEHCQNLMISDKPIIGNQCSKCLSDNGNGVQSMDYFQYIVTKSYPKKEYFCSCLLCRFGNTKHCRWSRCKLCTIPKISLRP